MSSQWVVRIRACAAGFGAAAAGVWSCGGSDGTALAAAAGPRRGLLAVGNAVIDHNVLSTAWDGPAVPVGQFVSAWSEEDRAAAVKAARENPSVESKVGGSALNALRVAKNVDVNDEIRVSFVGTVGKDSSAKLVYKVCAECGVEPLMSPVPELETGQCAIVIDKLTRDRTIMCIRGAAGSLDENKLGEIKMPWQEDPSADTMVFSTAFNYTTPGRRDAVEKVIGDRVFVGALSSATLLENFEPVRTHIQKLLPKTSLMFTNGEELLAYARAMGWEGGEDAIEQHAQKLAQGMAAPRLVFVTRGAKPTVVSNDKESVNYKVPVVDPIKGDTTGAGDSFAGGVLAHILLHADRSSLIRDAVKGLHPDDKLVASAVAVGIECATECLDHQGIAGPRKKTNA